MKCFQLYFQAYFTHTNTYPEPSVPKSSQNDLRISWVTYDWKACMIYVTMVKPDRTNSQKTYFTIPIFLFLDNYNILLTLPLKLIPLYTYTPKHFIH